MKRIAPILLLIVVMTGCYHAVIDTGASPGTTVIDKPWANSFIYGLVPPPVMETAAKCPGGVAKVETEHSFLNEVVGLITFGIYTPMHIRVTCAAQGVSIIKGDPEVLVPEADLVIREDATPEQAAEIFQAAVDLSVQSDAPVFVKFAAAQP
jgi:Bor protein